MGSTCSAPGRDTTALSAAEQLQHTQWQALGVELHKMEAKHASKLRPWQRSRNSSGYQLAALQQKAYMILRLQRTIQQKRALIASCTRSISNDIPARQRKDQRKLHTKRHNAFREISSLALQLQHWYSVPGDTGAPSFDPRTELDEDSLKNLDLPVPWDTGMVHSEGSLQARLAAAQMRIRRCQEERDLVHREVMDVTAFHTHYVGAIQVLTPLCTV